MAFEGDAARGPNLFQLASARITWLGERQKLVAANIANADTPGYRARDVTPFEEMLSRGELRPVEAKGGWDVSPDGNRVVLEEQALLATEIEGGHRMATQLYRKGHDLLRLAVKK